MRAALELARAAMAQEVAAWVGVLEWPEEADCPRGIVVGFCCWR
jgi:hypothetical protein